MSPAPVRSGKTLLCVEVLQDSHSEGSVALVVSLPGREGTLAKTWRCPGGRPDEAQLVDLQTWASKLLLDALLLSGTGIQGRLT